MVTTSNTWIDIYIIHLFLNPGTCLPEEGTHLPEGEVAGVRDSPQKENILLSNEHVYEHNVILLYSENLYSSC